MVAPLREIHMDDEDNNNGSRVFRWVGATLGAQKTTFRFCRVDGSRFHPLASASPSNVRAYYAVLKMGSQCPNGSFVFSRYFDNEDTWNGNWSRGDIAPSTVTSNTNMVFRLFMMRNLQIMPGPNLTEIEAANPQIEKPIAAEASAWSSHGWGVVGTRCSLRIEIAFAVTTLRPPNNGASDALTTPIQRGGRR